jgi:EmrB/QacA subfamily drug resistance transporter
LVLGATVLAASLAFLDGAVVNITLADIGKTFDTTGPLLQWLVTGYLLPLSVLQLLAGALGDHYGRRSILLAGTGLFVIASVACALAAGIETLLAARVLQGVGAALLLPNSLAVLGSAFAGPERGKAVGTWTAAGAIASALGPPLAGWLVDEASWRLVFLLNVPLGVAALWLTLQAVPESANKELPLDLPGTFVVTVALASLTWAVIHWSVTGLDRMSGALIAVSIAYLSILVKIEMARGSRAMIPLAMFGSASFVGLNLYTFFIYAAFGALFVLLPYVLMVVAHYPAAQAGAALLPLPVVLGIVSRFVGRYSAAHGWRAPLSLGAAVSAVGYGLFWNVNGGSYWLEVFPGVITIAIGMAIVIAPLTAAVLSSVDDFHEATAAGFNSAISRTGSLMAIAAAGAVMIGSRQSMLAAFHVAAIVGCILGLISCAISAFLAPLEPASEQTDTAR